MVAKISIVDQSIRDAQQSLWGLRMPTDMILPIAPVMDKVGYKAIGVGGGRGMVVAARYLKENMWERYRALSSVMKTPLRTSFDHWGPFNFDVEPLAASELWIKRCIANGVRSFWVCDYQLAMDRTTYLVNVARAEGAEVVGGIMYGSSPVHTDELFAQKTAKIVGMGGVSYIQVEDASGTLAPERVRTLIPAMQEAAKGIPIELHCHCNTSLAAQCYVEGLKTGITTLHTAVSPLANDTSMPSTENTLKNAEILGFSEELDMEALKAESDHFRKMAQEKGMRIGVPLEYDLFQFEHQLPGGMMGTLRNQLAELKQSHRLNDVLKEISKIREEFGYPIMATPYSQLVVVQALFNVTSGERYKVSSPEIVKYIKGDFGIPDGPIDQNVKDKIMNTTAGKKFANWKQPEITIDDLRKLEPGLSDDDLLLKIGNPTGEFLLKLNALYGI